MQNEETNYKSGMSVKAGMWAKLKCRHCISSNSCHRYTMKCKILKLMGDGRVKIEVYGDRYWDYNKDKHYVRYVSINRLISGEDEN